MPGADAEKNPPFNDPKHPGWYTEPQSGQQGNPAPPAPPSAAPRNPYASQPAPSGNPYASQPAAPGNPYAYQPGPGMQPAPQHNPYGGPGYVQPPYYAPPAESKGLSVAALVCGIVGVVSFGFLFLPQIAAIILGHIALGREPGGRGMALGGLIMGYIVTGLWVLLLAIGVIATMAEGA